MTSVALVLSVLDKKKEQDVNRTKFPFKFFFIFVFIFYLINLSPKLLLPNNKHRLPFNFIRVPAGEMEFRQKCWPALVRGDRGEGSEVTELLAVCQTLRMHMCTCALLQTLLDKTIWPASMHSSTSNQSTLTFSVPHCGVDGCQKQKYSNSYQPLKKMAVANKQPCREPVNMSQCCQLCAPMTVLILSSLSHFRPPAAAWVELALQSLIKTVQPTNRRLWSPHKGLRVDWSIIHQGLAALLAY